MNVDKITNELEQLGYVPEVLTIESLGGKCAVTFDYLVNTGRYKGEKFRVGLAFQEYGYPEYPPHFVWIANLPTANFPTHSSCQYNGLEWKAMSLPPNDFWDKLPVDKKNMKTYISRHMDRVWYQM